MNFCGEESSPGYSHVIYDDAVRMLLFLRQLNHINIVGFIAEEWNYDQHGIIILENLIGGDLEDPLVLEKDATICRRLEIMEMITPR